MSIPSSGSKNKPSKKPSWKQVASRTFAFTLVSFSAYSPTLKIEATCSSEMLVHFQRTTWRYVPEDRTLHNHGCKNLKSYTVSVASSLDKSFRRKFITYVSIPRFLLVPTVFRMLCRLVQITQCHGLVLSVPDSYQGRSWVQISAQYQTVLAQVFSSCLQSYQANARIVPQMGPRPLLSHTSQFSIHLHSIIRHPPYNVGYWMYR
jgi:hypothetical protein